MNRPVEVIKLVHCWKNLPDRTAPAHIADRLNQLHDEHWSVRRAHFGTEQSFLLLENPTAFLQAFENTE